MIERSRQCLKILNIALTLTTLFIFMSVGQINAYALNDNYIIDEYHQWLEVDNRYDYNKTDDGFDGFLKSVSDEKSGCFYIFFKFFDTRISDSYDENIILTFTIENDVNSYCFSLNSGGFINTGQNDKNAVNVISNFDNFSCSSMGGEIFIGFQLKNSADRVLANYISCDYAAGVNTISPLFENEILDMYEEPTEKAETAKNKSEKTASSKEKTVKSNTAKSSTAAAKSNSDSKSNKGDASTKFSGRGIYSSKTESDNSDEVQKSETVLSQEVEPSDVKMSKTSVIILIVSAAAILSGIIILTAALAAKTKTENEKTESNIEEQQTQP